MQQQRAHQQHAAPIAQTGDLAAPFPLGQHLRLRQPALPVRAGHDAQRTRRRAAIVEVQAHGDQRFQDLPRRLYV